MALGAVAVLITETRQPTGEGGLRAEHGFGGSHRRPQPTPEHTGMADDAPREVMDRVLVYSNGKGRTKTVPWQTTLPAAFEVEVNGDVFHLVADSKVTRELDETQTRIRAWNATRGSKAA